jgi:hypothetical protein
MCFKAAVDMAGVDAGELPAEARMRRQRRPSA